MERLPSLETVLIDAAPPRPLFSRTDALDAGALRYYTGIPCGRGHDSERYTTNGQCVACVARYGALREEARRAGKLRVAKSECVVPLSKPRGVTTDWNNLTAEQVEAWYERVRTMKSNSKLYRHHPLDEPPLRTKT